MMAGCPGCGKSKEREVHQSEERHIRARRGTSTHRILDHSISPLLGLSEEFQSADVAEVSGGNLPE